LKYKFSFPCVRLNIHYIENISCKIAELYLYFVLYVTLYKPEEEEKEKEGFYFVHFLYDETFLIKSKFHLDFM